MRELPDDKDLTKAVAEFLRNEVMPQIGGRVGFHVRVAANVLDTVAREASLGPAAKERELARLQKLTANSGNAETLTRDLCTAIRENRIAWDDPELLKHLWQTTLDTLAIDQPRYGTFRAINMTLEDKKRTTQ